MDYTNKKVIVRCNRAGVFYGILKEYDKINREATLTDCRRLWYWKGACSLSEMAVSGVKKTRDCKFSVIVPEMVVMEVIELLPASEDAIKSIEEVEIWRY